MRVNRASVWITLVLMIVFVGTGYALTRPNLIYSLSSGLIDYQTALYLHTTLDVPLLSLLLLHIMIEIKFSLMRWGFKNQRLLNVLILLLSFTILALILQIDGARA